MTASGGDGFDFDYSMQFASPAAATKWIREPTVFLFGWAGCHDRYLSKYAEFYHQLGCNTIRYTAPTSIVFHRSKSGFEEIGRRMNDLFYEMDLAEQPYLVHSFSGNGCLVLRAWRSQIQTGNIPEWADFVSEAAGQPESDAAGDSVLVDKDRAAQAHKNLLGLVFDSCPAESTHLGRAAAYVEVFFPGLQCKCVRVCLRLAFAVSFVVISWVRIFLGGIEKLIWGRSAFLEDTTYYKALLQDEALSQVPQLYLYSEADAVCSSKSIEAFIDAQRARHAKIVVKRWPDLPHCQLYRFDPEEYRKVLTEFIFDVASRFLNVIT